MNTGLQKQLSQVQVLLQQNQVAAARQLAETLALAPQAGRDAWYWLAISRARAGDHKDARDAIKKAISLSHPDANLHLTAANIYQDVGDTVGALMHAKRSVEIDPRFAQGYNNLGILLADQERLDEADAAFRAAIRLKPDYARAFANLSTTLSKRERAEDALKAAEQCVRLQPYYAHGQYAYAVAALQLERLADAEAALKEAVVQLPTFVDAWMLLAKVLRRLKRHGDAFNALGRLLATAPDRIDAMAMAGDCAWALGDEVRARAIWRAALDKQPDSLECRIRSGLSLPEVYESDADLCARRAHFVASLHQLTTEIPQIRAARGGDLLREIQFANFHLAYQGCNDKTVQREYADFVAAILRDPLPQFFTPVPFVPARAKIHVGFVSRFFYECTAGHYFESWVTKLDRDSFDVSVFSLRPMTDPLTERIKARAERYFCDDEKIEQIAARVRAANLDILIYPELAMEPKVFALAALRLAPLQACAWGHPVTPGHRNIDYFLSAGVMEPPHGEQHYNEMLVRLPGIGTRYGNPAHKAVSLKTRADIGLPAIRNLYFCPQSLFKILPENDALMAAVLARDPNGIIIFFSTDRQKSNIVFARRLAPIFAAAGVDFKERTLFMGHLVHSDYKRLNQLCDVMLDTLHWSGGNTSLDALAMGLPIVTLPGEFMRGRQTAGMLTLMGIEELIAKDKEDYVRIAVKLGTDKTYRQAMSEKILANHDKVFDDPKPIVALQDFIRDAVNQRRAIKG